MVSLDIPVDSGWYMLPSCNMSSTVEVHDSWSDVCDCEGDVHVVVRSTFFVSILFLLRYNPLKAVKFSAYCKFVLFRGRRDEKKTTLE